jgi:hypothetical protein
MPGEWTIFMGLNRWYRRIEEEDEDEGGWEGEEGGGRERDLEEGGTGGEEGVEMRVIRRRVGVGGEGEGGE